LQTSSVAQKIPVYLLSLGEHLAVLKYLEIKGLKKKEKKREREKKKRNQLLSEVDYYLHNLSFSIHRYAVQQCELFIL